MIPGLGRPPGEGKSYPLQYSGVENSMDCIVYGVAKSQTRLSDFHFHMGFPGGSDSKESSCNAGDPGSTPGEGIGYPLQYSWASLMAQLVKNPPAMWETWVRSLGWEDPLRKEQLPTPVYWPGEFHGLYSPWGHKESDTTERLLLTDARKD